MSEQLPGPSEPGHLARASAVFDGSLPIEGMERLAASLYSTTGQLHYQLRFAMEGGVPVLRGHVSGALELVCQRCLDAMPWTLDSGLAVAFVATDWEVEQLPDELEGVRLDEGARIRLEDVIEDEALLALPVIPRHAPDACIDLGAATATHGEMTEDVPPSEEGGAEGDNPFAVLATLKDGRSRS